MEKKTNIEMKALILGVVLFIYILNFPIILAENETSEEAICEEQLDVLLDEYNNLLKDFRQGTNCGGTAFGILKDMNELLTEERNHYLEEVGELKVFRVGFYSALVIAILAVITLFIVIWKRQ